MPTANGRPNGIIAGSVCSPAGRRLGEGPGGQRRALASGPDDLAAAEALTPPLSTFYRQEYLAALESLTNLQPLITARAEQHHDRGRWHLVCPRAGTGGVSQWRARAEPPGAEPAGRQRPGLVRSPGIRSAGIRGPGLRIPEPDPAAPAAARALAPEELARWADSALITPALNWRLGELDKWERIDRWSLNQLTEAVAVSLFTKETGHRPRFPGRSPQAISPITRRHAGSR